MITINMKRDDIEKVRFMLSEVKNAPARVISRAINKTLTGVKTDASTAVRGIITAKKSAVDKTFKSSIATLTNLSGAFQSTGRPLPLIDYAARQTKAGVSVQVKKLKPRKVIPGTFISTVRSSQQAEAGSAGHTGVFWRVYRGDKKPVKKTGYSKLPKKYRLPIEQKFGPRVPDILSNEPVMAGVLKKADERLHTNMERELNFELSKL
jgi:hypothetical protein